MLTTDQKLFFQSFFINVANNAVNSLEHLDPVTPYYTANLKIGPLYLDYHWLTTSTLDWAPHVKPNTILWADGQFVGKGQYQRRWSSAIGQQLQCTFVLPFSSYHSLFPIYALFQALLCHIPKDSCLHFKWPNDIYLNKKKIAGVLIHQWPQATWVSFGLNTTFKGDILNIGSLWPHKHAITRLELLEGIVHSLLQKPPCDQFLASYVAKNHIISPHTLTQFSTRSDPVYFEGFLASGKPILRTQEGILIKDMPGSFVLNV